MKKLIEADAAAYKDKRLRTETDAGLYEALWKDAIFRRTKMTGLVLETEDKATTIQKIWNREQDNYFKWKFANSNHAVSVASVGAAIEISVQ